MRLGARLGTFTDRILSAIAVALVAAIVIIVNIQVVGRYFLSMSLPWPEELARYVMVWAVFMGSALALRRGSMIRVEFVVDRLRRPIRRVVELLAAVLSVVGLLIVFWASLPLLGPAGETAEPGTGIPQRWVYLALPVGMILLVLFTIERALRPSNGPTGEGPTGESPTGESALSSGSASTDQHVGL